MDKTSGTPGTSREPPCSELESQCERSDHISLRYLQGVNLVERRQVDFYLCDVVNLLMLCVFKLWEHDSTVSVRSCQLESTLLWLICVLSSCKCGSAEEEERQASRSTMSCLVISLRLGVMLGM